MRTTTVTALTVAFGFSIAGLACNGSPTSPSSQSGNLRVMITDTPFEDAAALHVTFSGIKAHRADGAGGWITVPFAGTPAATSRTCNLKKLEGPFDVLGVATLDAGLYTQLRLVVESASIYFGGTPTGEPACAATLAAPSGAGMIVETLEIPSGEVKLIHPFEGFPFCRPLMAPIHPRSAEPTRLFSSHHRPGSEAVTQPALTCRGLEARASKGFLRHRSSLVSSPCQAGVLARAARQPAGTGSAQIRWSIAPNRRRVR